MSLLKLSLTAEKFRATPKVSLYDLFTATLAEIYFNFVSLPSLITSLTFLLSLIFKRDVE